MKETKEIAWVIKYRKGKLWKVYSHCNVNHKSFRGKLRYINGSYSEKYRDLFRQFDTILISDRLIISKARLFEDFMGQHLELFM